MSEPRTSVRMNISIPADLKREMDASSGDVNWSSVAAGAFRDKLQQLRAHQGVTTMDDVIARLKAANELDADQDYAAGQQAGEEWAKRHARPKELRRLQKCVEESDGNGAGDAAGYIALCNNGRNRGHVWDLAADVSGDRSISAREVEVFWEECLGEDEAALVHEPAYGRGWVEGALRVWQTVQDSI